MENVFYIHGSASFIFPENYKMHRNKTQTQKLDRNTDFFFFYFFLNLSLNKKVPAASVEMNVKMTMVECCFESSSGEGT